MKHWIGVLCLAGVVALIAYSVASDEPAGVLADRATRTAGQISSSLYALAVILAIIGLIGLARDLMKNDEPSRPQPPPG